MSKITGYHGTVWERPLIPTDEGFRQNFLFNQLNPGASDLESVFFCNQETVARFFSGIRIADEENQVQAVLRGSVDLERVHAFSLGGHGIATWEGATYRIPDERLAFYHAVRAAGFDGVMMLNDYKHRDGTGHDIAIFHESAFVIEAARLKIGEKWTPWLTEEKALSMFRRWSELSDGLDQSREVGFG